MAPGIHPPCTPSPSCMPLRCHPTPPPCANPERCLRRTIKKGLRPCQSALSVLATKAPRCGNCGRFKGEQKPDNFRRVRSYLKRKSKERKLRKKDRLTGSRSFSKYQRKKGRPLQKQACCAGKGHRGRLKRRCCQRCCTIL